MSNQRAFSVAALVTVVLLPVFLAGVFIGRPSVVPLTPDEKVAAEKLISPQFSPSRNAALIYCRLFQHMEVDGYLKQKRGFLMQVIRGNVSAKDSGLPRAIPQGNGQPWERSEYEELDRARTMVCDFNLDYSMGPYLLLPHFSKMRVLAYVMLIQARYDFEDGQPDLITRDVAYVFTMARHISREPMAISQMAAFNIDETATDVLTAMAFKLRTDKDFLNDALELLRSTPAHLTNAADIIRKDVQMTTSYFLRRINDPHVKSIDIVDDLRVATGEGAGPGNDDVLPWINLSARRERLDFEKDLSLPQGALATKNFRQTLAKAVVICQQKAQSYAEAVEKGLAMVLEWNSSFEKRFDNEDAAPETFLARMILPCLERFPFDAARRDARRRAAIAVLEALIRCDKEIRVTDPFGKPYKVTWFDDSAYFESASQWREAHDMDFALPAGMSYEDFQQKVENKDIKPR